MFRFPFIPREEKFFKLFEGSAQNMVKAAQALKQLVDTWENVGERVSEIVELEHEGDHITHRIMEELHGTFVTPLDREDIALLADRLDDVMDYLEDTAIAMQLYKIEKPTDRSKELADILVKMADELVVSMPRLRKRSKMKQILNITYYS